jgi:hypothetical protein
MSRLDEIAEKVGEFWTCDDIAMQHHLLRSIGLKCVFLGVDARTFFKQDTSDTQAEYGGVVCPDCQKQFKNNHALRAHVGRMHKS